MAQLVGPLDELPERACRVVRADGAEIGVIRVGGEVYAYENRCAHQGGPVCHGEVLGRLVELLDERRRVVGERFSEDELHLVCPWHGWEYDVTTGVCAADPRFRLRARTVEVRDGVVFLVD